MRSDNIQLKDYFWNTLGTVLYAAASLLLSIIIINITGKIEGGIFSFGYSTLAQIVFKIAYFGVRPMHIVDINYRYSFLTYKKFGFYTSCFALLIGFIYITMMFFLDKYSITKFMILFILIVHGAIDGFADFYECEYQRSNKLYMGGQSQFFRILVFITTLISILYFTKNLLLSEIIAVILEIIAFIFLNVVRSKDIFKTVKSKTSNISSLFKESFPLFLIVFFDMYIISSTKFAIDMHLTDVDSGFFNLIYMPTYITYLLMNLFMKPFLTPLSNAYYHDKRLYGKLIFKSIIVGAIITMIFIIGTILFGEVYINIIDLFTADIYLDYRAVAKTILTIVVGAGCFYTIVTPMYYMLIIEQKQTSLCIAYIITFIFSIFIANHFVVNMGLIGAAYGSLTNMFVLFTTILIAKALNR